MNLFTRVLSSLVALGVLVLVAQFSGAKGLFILSIFVVFVASYEASLLLLDSPYIKLPTAVLATGVFTLLSIKIETGLYALSLSIVFLIGIITFTPFKEREKLFKLQSGSLLVVFYCGLFPGFIGSILFAHNSLTLFSTLLAIVFCGDTFAYLFGSKFGKHKILPAISPSKSWEGTIFGLIGSICASIILSKWNSIAIIPSIILGLGTGLCAQLGDFFESSLKRLKDVKDTGQIMPGHGGMLDRLDGLFFGGPIFYWLALVIFR